MSPACRLTKLLSCAESLIETVVLTTMLAGELAVVARLGLTGLTRTVSELQGLGFGVGLLLAWSPVKSALTCHAYQPAMVGLNEPELALQL